MKDGHVYVKAGKAYGGDRPEGMSDDQYHSYMVQKGFKKMTRKAYGEMGKSVDPEVEATELTKALGQLADLVKASDPASRKRELFEKSSGGDDLTSEEQAELVGLISGGGASGSGDLAKSALAALNLEGSDALKKSVEVSPYLQAHHEGSVEAIRVLADAVEKSQNATSGFNVVLAKAIVQVGRGLDDLRKSLDHWGDRPMSRPRSAQTPAQAKAQVIEKSFAGEADASERLSKGQVLSYLEAMHKSAPNGMASCGEDLMMAIAKFDSTQHMSKSLYVELKDYIAKSRVAA